MEHYTLIGHPLGHSMSPWIHARLFAMSGREAEYTLTDLAPEALDAAAKTDLKALSGFNITIPYKVDIIPYLSEMDNLAAGYHSVNTVAVDKNGGLHGYNTDCVGFARSVGSISPGMNILQIGCGGVGRMMATECYLRAADLTIIEKNLPLAEALAAEFKEKYPNAKGSIRVLESAPEDEQFDLLMNASPVGMYPNANRCPVTDKVIENSARVFDVIYNPTATLLVQKARAMGKEAVGGAAMLVWQAVRAHEIWYGFDYKYEDIEALITEMEAEVNRLFPAKEGAGA